MTWMDVSLTLPTTREPLAVLKIMFKVEQDTLVAAMTSQGWEETVVAVHIGLSKKGGTWQWDNSGKDLTSDIARWGTGSPSGDGSCAGIWGTPLTSWNDYPCNYQKHGEKPFGAICEI